MRNKIIVKLVLFLTNLIKIVYRFYDHKEINKADVILQGTKDLVPTSLQPYGVIENSTPFSIFEDIPELKKQLGE